MNPIEMDTSKTSFSDDFSIFIFNICFSFASYGEANAVLYQARPEFIEAVTFAYGHLPRVIVKVTSLMTNNPLIAGGQSIRSEDYRIHATNGQALNVASCKFIHNPPGVVDNLRMSSGTGAGKSLQERAEITFQKEAAE